MLATIVTNTYYRHRSALHLLRMPLLRTKSKSPPTSRRIPLRPLSNLSTDLGLLLPAQFPPETASALSQVNPSPGFENVFSDHLIAHSGDNEDVNEENVIEGIVGDQEKELKREGSE